MSLLGRIRVALLGLGALSLLVTSLSSSEARSARGPLRVCPENPRYFTDGSGKAVYLTGSHTWNNLQDVGPGDPPPRADFAGQLDFMVAHHQNLMRMWKLELFQFDCAQTGTVFNVQPFPYPRTGPGLAADGKPKFDLSRFEESYFQRLRSRVVAAGKRGIYVSVMLFEGDAVQRLDAAPPTDLTGHPYDVGNNINGVEVDPGKTKTARAVIDLSVPAITRLQEAYVRKVVDTVNDLDNVLYEICNEASGDSLEWEFHMVRFIKDYEAGKPKQHPVGITAVCQVNFSNETLLTSPADWISPGHLGCICPKPEVDHRTRAQKNPYFYDPPAADGRKVIIPDTDHLGNDRGRDCQIWVWKAFTRGMNPIFMDVYRHESWDYDARTKGRLDPSMDPIRQRLGDTRKFAERMELVKMKPMGELASTKYCLANPGHEYLVYLPDGGTVTVDLSAAGGRLAAEWFNPTTGRTEARTTVTGGAPVELTAPFAGEAALYLRR